jgi:hypothetical protein
MNQIKYIRTRDNRIIVFSGLFNHSDFRNYNPISAGFIMFEGFATDTPRCVCYGRSISLDLHSAEDDTRLANAQLFGIYQ